MMQTTERNLGTVEVYGNKTGHIESIGNGEHCDGNLRIGAG